MTRLLLSPVTLAIVVGLISFAVFLPAVRNGFATNWDDNTNLINNPYFRGLGRTQLRWMWTNHLMEHYVPLAWMSFGLDYTLWKQNPFGFHLTNIILHALNTTLFCFLASLILRLSFPEESRKDVRVFMGAAFAALFFGLHPLRVESVAWVTERRDVLSGLFYLLALLAYLQAFRKHSSRTARRAYYWSCFAFFLAAVLSKEIAVTLPVILLILDVYPLRRLGSSSGRWFGWAVWRVWAEKAPFFVVSLADAAMTIYVAFRHHLPESLATLGWMPRFAITVYGMAFYVIKTIAPLSLSPLYPLTPHKIDPKAMPYWASLAFVFAISYAALVLCRRYPWLLATWLAYGVTLLPVGGLIHNGSQIAADRYTYLSCLGWALLAGAGVAVGLRYGWRSPWTGIPLTALTLGLLVALAWQSRVQLAVWRDSDTIWSRAVAIEPSALALTNLGAAFIEEGDVLGAIACYRRAIAMSPKFGLAHNNLGLALFELRRFDEAIQEFRAAQKLQPDLVAAYDGMGNALLFQNKLDAAIATYRLALNVDPHYVPAQKNLDVALKLQASRTQ